MPCLFNQSRSRRQTEHNISATLLNGAVQHLYLVGRRIRIIHIHVGIADIITFDEIHTPLCVKTDNGIVVLLCPRNSCTDTVHIRVPLADGRRICHITRIVEDILRARLRHDGKMTVCRLPRDSTHNVDTEFQSLGMHIICQRPESCTICGGRKFLRTRKQPSVVIHLDLSKGNVLVLIPLASGMPGIPLDVHHNVFPSIRQQMLCHIVRIGLDLRLIDIGIIIIVAVPPHGCLIHSHVQTPPIPSQSHAPHVPAPDAQSR